MTVTEVRVVTASVGRGTARRASGMVWSIVRAMHASGERVFGREHPPFGAAAAAAGATVLLPAFAIDSALRR